MGRFFGLIGARLGDTVTHVAQVMPRPEDVRMMIVALASRTGWGLGELLDLTLTELVAWMEAARDVEPRL